MHMKMYLICLLIRCDESKPSLPPLWCSSYLVFCLYRILMLFCVQYQQILSTCDGVSLEVLFEFEWKGQPSISWHAAMSLILHNLMSLRMFFVHLHTIWNIPNMHAIYCMQNYILTIESDANLRLTLITLPYLHL